MGNMRTYIILCTNAQITKKQTLIATACMEASSELVKALVTRKRPQGPTYHKKKE